MEGLILVFRSIKAMRTIHLISLFLLITSSLSAKERLFFYHTDPLGTPILITDEKGEVVWRERLLPFGEREAPPFPPIDEGEERRLFLGHYYDHEISLYYFGKRYLDPSIGRFLQPDPIGPVDPWTSRTNESLLLDPQRLNPYAYGANNPYRNIDIEGAWLETAVDIGFTIWDIKEFVKDPSWEKAGWIGLDIVCIALPVASPAMIKGARIIAKTDRAVDVVGVTVRKAERIEKGWRLGDPVNKLTRAGRYPSWSTVRARYWKNEALRHPQKYSPENLARMRKGLAPRELNKVTGKLESKQLHHLRGRNTLDPHNPKYLKPLWPDEHIRIHFHR
jgi:RHS repeat-associated protein